MHPEKQPTPAPPDPPTGGQAPLPDFPAAVDVNGEDMDSIADMETDKFHELMDRALATTHVNNAESSMNVPTKEVSSAGDGEMFPHANTEGNEWLAKLLTTTKRATEQEINMAFSHPELQGMKNYWMAEHASGEGKCGGGSLLPGRSCSPTSQRQSAGH